MIDAASLSRRVHEAREALEARLPGEGPQVGLILGSGLSAGSLPLEDAVEVPVEEIPHLPAPTVVGHRGVWTFGRLAGRRVVVAGGRVHRYEGLSLREGTLGVRLIRALGADALIVTNAAGGIRPDLTPGTLMRIRDHLNLLGDSPLVGDHDESLGARFVDLTEAYDAAWWERVRGPLGAMAVGLGEGVYAACLGPQYETPAEIDHLERIGADAVGMSTVPEVIVARQVGLAVFGMSLISNAAAGRGDGTLSHDEVVEAGRAAMAHWGEVVTHLVREAPVG
ncbi:MAG: purine-nucleoside phosphorylase [Planctomycetota bacterium]